MKGARQRFTHCMSCGLPLVPRSYTVIPEGHRRHRLGGMCTACYAPKPETKIAPCKSCGTPLLFSSTKAVPEGLKRHGGRGYCPGCYARVTRGPSAQAETARAKTGRPNEALESFLRSRRARGVPAAGHPIIQKGRIHHARKA